MARFGERLEVGQARYRGIEFGIGQAITIEGMSGWGGYGVDVGDISHSGVGGDLPGRYSVQARTISMFVHTESPHFHVVQELFAPSREDDLPFEFHSWPEGVRWVGCRPSSVRRVRGGNRFLGDWEVTLRASSPWLLGVQQQERTLTAGAGTLTGVNFPQDFPIDFEAEVAGTPIAVAGAVPAAPVVVFQGPTGTGMVTRIRLQNRDH